MKSRECEALAAQTTDHATKLELHELARKWLKLVHQAEGLDQRDPGWIWLDRRQLPNLSPALPKEGEAHRVLT